MTMHLVRSLDAYLPVAMRVSFLLAGVAATLALWAVQVVLAGRFVWKKDSVASANTLAQADPILAYLERTKRLITNDPDLWFLFGVQEVALGRKTRAWERPPFELVSSVAI